LLIAKFGLGRFCPQEDRPVRSRQYYEALSDQQLIDAARFEAREGRPQPELLAVLADRLEDINDELPDPINSY
jgi:hypothetical protein